MARPPLTDDQLQRAFRVYRRPSWPTSFEAAMADPIVSRLVRLRATGDAIDAERAGRAQPLSPFQRWRARAAGPAQLPLGLDAKSRAAGERLDD